MHDRRWAGTALALLLAALIVIALGGCAPRVGSASTAQQWRDDADQVLGSAISALGTARTVLEGRDAGDLPQSYAVVALQDATDALEKDLTAFVDVRPPRSLADRDRDVLARVQEAVALLHAAGTAVTGSAGSGRAALTDLRRAYDDAVAARDAVGATP
ncbi:hypothetical protein ABIE44_002362 [Marmoricola sp. OAE513]|uniref:hypothetical protein n=1 Tax=Marmoricola sp. OAE513 TaxID=2817894 RepID=UPI001AE144C8